MQINLCLSSDENYARHVGFTLYSALVYSQACDQYEVYVLDGGISPESKRDMQDKLSCFNNLRIHYVDVRSSSALDKCRTPGTSSHITLATYYRFLIPSLIPCDKVLYLDCDILVCHDLHELFEIEIEEYYMGLPWIRYRSDTGRGAGESALSTTSMPVSCSSTTSGGERKTCRINCSGIWKIPSTHSITWTKTC